MSLSERIQNNPITIVAVALVTGFGAGFGAYQTMLDVGQLEVSARRSSCPVEQVALRVEVHPADAQIEISGHGESYYPGICLEQKRYSLVITHDSDNYKREQRTVQLGNADYLSLVTLLPKAQIELGGLVIEEKEYVGERLSLNFQDAEVRAVLQQIADFTDLNLVVSDEVESSNITLRLKNVPWDQVLDVIADSKNLAISRSGSIISVKNRKN